MTFVWGGLLFGVGLAIMLASDEGLVKSVAARAAALGVSGLALGALSTSLDPESTGAGLAAASKNLPAIAVGSHVGSVVFIATLALGVLAVIHPFEVEGDRYFIQAVALVTGLAVAIIASGTLDRVRGGCACRHLLGSRPWSHKKTLAPSRPDLTRSGTNCRLRWTSPHGWPSLDISFRLAGRSGHRRTGGRVRTIDRGSQRLLDTLGWSTTIFGPIVIAIAISLEEGLLELIPAHRGHPEISIGNVLGTITFLLGGSLGLIGLIHPVTFTAPVQSFHAVALASRWASGLGADPVKGRNDVRERC